MSGEDGETEHVVLVGIRVEPNNCPIEEELTLTMDFDTKVDVLGGRWEVRFIADTASKRKIVCLGQTAEQDYHAGQHQMAFTVDRIDVSHLKRHVLANVGLLTASLYDHNNVEYVQVNMVTQVSLSSNTHNNKLPSARSARARAPPCALAPLLDAPLCFLVKSPPS